MKVGKLGRTTAIAALSIALSGAAVQAEEKTLDIGVSDALTGRRRSLSNWPLKRSTPAAASRSETTPIC